MGSESVLPKEPYFCPTLDSFRMAAFSDVRGFILAAGSGPFRNHKYYGTS